VIRTLAVERLMPFRRLLPTDIYVLAKAALLAVAAVQAARLIWVIFTPVGPFGNWQPASPKIIPLASQTVLFSSVDPFFRAAAPGAAAALAVDLQLFGVRQGVGALPSGAIMGAADGEQKSYIVGDEVAPGVRLANVFFDHVVVARGPAKQTIYMQGLEPGAAPDALQTPPSAAGEPASTSGLTGQAFAMTPRNQGGRITGIQVGPGSNAALFAGAGFRPGDVIVAVNGARITSMVDIQQLQASIAPGARLMLTVERGAQAVPIALNVPGNS
jgi:general secretion pathway protein C